MIWCSDEHVNVNRDRIKEMLMIVITKAEASKGAMTRSGVGV